LPVSRPPIEDGAVRLIGGRIAAVGRWRDLRPHRLTASVVDLGEAVLMPGLVNAHCHLDYTQMAGCLPPPRSFSDWISGMLALKSSWSYSEFAESWIAGARQLLQSGVTTVADIEAMPELLPEVWQTTPLRVISLLEMTGIQSERPPHLILRDAVLKIKSLPRGLKSAGLSPHAPYSTTPDLLALAAMQARWKGWLVSTHVAESSEEFEMFMHRRGPMFEWLRRRRDAGDCGGISPVQLLARHEVLGDNFIAVHVNYLAHDDAKLLAASGSSVVHCPRSHIYFGHAPFPYKNLSRARVNICLGTDSLATVRKIGRQPLFLSMFEEMRQFAINNPLIPPEAILKMATINGARALGLSGKIGELREGACADLITIPYAGPVASVAEAVVNYQGNARETMIDGKWVWPDKAEN